MKIVGCKCCVPTSESKGEKTSTASAIEISMDTTIDGYVPDRMCPTLMRCMYPLYRDVPAKLGSDVDLIKNDITKMKAWKLKLLLAFIVAGMAMVIAVIGSGVYFGVIKGKVRTLTQKHVEIISIKFPDRWS